MISDRSLRENIRHLGRVLGEVIRAKEGEDTFHAIESIRQAAVRFHREGDPAAAWHLDQLLQALPLELNASVVRAFSYFTHLVNIAEDLHQHRRDCDSAQPGQLDYSLARIDQVQPSAETVRAFFASAMVAPVLTAHPTEVQRQSILDTERSISSLLEARQRSLPAREAQRIDRLIHAAITALWQTRMLRLTRLTVSDEINNALSYYHMTFLDAVPELLQDLELEIGSRLGEGAPYHLPALLEMGSWIGGDRDGNPNVDADTLQQAIMRQATTAIEYYQDQVDALHAELSLSSALVEVTPDLLGLADRSPEHSPHRADEPYRRALVGIQSRLTQTCTELTGQEGKRRQMWPATAYANAEGLRRHRRARRRPHLPSHHGTAAGYGRRPDPHHRTR